MSGPHEIRQVVSDKKNIFCCLKNIFRCSHSQCSIFVEVDCSGYGAASVVRASLRHVIEDIMDGNITTGKHTVLFWGCLRASAKVNKYCNCFVLQKTE